MKIEWLLLRWQVLHLDLPEHLNERGVHASLLDLIDLQAVDNSDSFSLESSSLGVPEPSYRICLLLWSDLIIVVIVYRL